MSELFGRYGELEEKGVRLPLDRNFTGDKDIPHKGFAFITYKSIDAARMALEQTHGLEFMDKELTVKKANEDFKNVNNKRPRYNTSISNDSFHRKHESYSNGVGEGWNMGYIQAVEDMKRFGIQYAINQMVRFR